MSPTARRLGLLTLGQSPREDVTPTFKAILGGSVGILERGALDGLDREGLLQVTAKDGESPLETRLGSGAAIGLSRAALMPHLIAAGTELSGVCDRVVLLCSGEFPALAAACPRLIQPIRILRGAISAVAEHRLLGLIGPASDLAAAPAQWRPYAPNLLCAAASPYDGLATVMAAGRELARQGVDLIFLDDMGFSEVHRLAVAGETRLPVVCATTLTARMLCELVG
ncbi:MAG: AroM family protein [Holophaga sp.]|nr:AroM family protein [Holophaga sp.]